MDLGRAVRTAGVIALTVLALVACAAAPGARSLDGGARWAWPTGSRVVIRGWDAPVHDYAPGHRGVDVLAELGEPVRAPDDGVVAFAGQVGGRSVVTVDHGGGLVSTLDSVVPVVTAGSAVARGSVVGSVSAGHCTAAAMCLHLGARVDGRYVDPLQFLGAPEWPVLLPLGGRPLGAQPLEKCPSVGCRRVRRQMGTSRRGQARG